MGNCKLLHVEHVVGSMQPEICMIGCGKAISRHRSAVCLQYSSIVPHERGLSSSHHQASCTQLPAARSYEIRLGVRNSSSFRDDVAPQVHVLKACELLSAWVFLSEHAQGVVVPHVMRLASALTTLVVCVGLFGLALGGTPNLV